MITYENKAFWQRPLFLAAVAGVVAAGAAWWFTRTPDASTPEAATAKAPSSSWITPGSTPAAQPEAFNQSALLAEGRPADMPEADWNALKSVLSKQMPNAEAEAARVVDYLRYQKRFEYWQTTEGSKSPKERAALAEALLQEVPARLAKGEFTAGEALLMNTVLISESEPNEKIRLERITEMQQQLLKLGPPQDNEKLIREAERATEQKRLIATTFAEWQTRPDATRTPAALESAMADAQRAFNAGITE